jgi:hypothetical protein
MLPIAIELLNPVYGVGGVFYSINSWLNLSWMDRTLPVTAKTP